MKKTTFTLILLLTTVFSYGQTHADSAYHQKMQWFSDAKLGIFIHWGLYAVNGIDESWSFFNGYISHKDYLKQTQGFTAKNYDPKVWASLIKESGAKYAVITTKHHDGFALWKTKYGNLNAVESSPAGRDLIAPFAKAIRDEGLKFGAYFSLPDWSYPDYDVETREVKRYDIDKEARRWKKFLDYYQGQLKELSQKFNPDLWWFDGDWEHSAEEWQSEKMKAMLLKNNPKTIINARLGGNTADYATPEQGVPVSRPKSDYWELCMTMNDSWGYQDNDHNYKTANQIIRTFIDCIAMGGNLLLDIGPKADGTIPDEQVAILKELGRWTHKHEEAIYGTQAGIPLEHYYGRTTLSADSSILYLFVPHSPNGPIMLKGLKNKINRIWVVGNGTKLSHNVVGKAYWSSVPGVVYINIPEKELDPQVTVLALLLDGPVSLYSESGGVISSN